MGLKLTTVKEGTIKIKKKEINQKTVYSDGRVNNLPSPFETMA